MLLPRPASGEYAPALLCLVLLAGLAMQVALPATTALPAAGPRMTRPMSSPAAATIPDYAAILAAPIFSPSRRPGEAADIGAGDSQRPVLVGVASLGRSGSVVLRGSDGVAHVLRAGESWRGWRLVGLGAASATLDGPGGRFTAIVGDIRSPASPPGGPSALQDTNP